MWVEPAHPAVAEICFLPRLDAEDVRGPEKVNERERCREQCRLASQVARMIIGTTLKHAVREGQI
jgi:hypothetical protein